MYALVLATLFTTGNEIPDFGRRGGCFGCYGGCFGCRGGCFGGCFGGCWGGCYGGCWGGCYGGCYGCYGGCYGCYGGCYGCSGGVVIYSGCCGGSAASGGGGGGGGGGSGSSRGGGSRGSSGGGGGGQGAGQGGGQNAGQGEGSSDLSQDLQELKKSLEEMKKEQSKLRIEALKQVAEELRLKATDQKIDELRRAIEEIKRRPVPAPIPLPMPLPAPGLRPALPAPQPGKVQLEVPSGAIVFVDDRPLTSSTFVTPPLEAGKEQSYRFEVAIVRDGRNLTRVKRVSVHPGETVRLAYEEMESGHGWTRAGEAAPPARVTVRLPADARLTVDGVVCTLDSDTRTFDTPPLSPGEEYAYVLKAEVVRAGQTVTQTRRVTFRPGQRVTVSFDNLGVSRLTSR